MLRRRSLLLMSTTSANLSYLVDPAKLSCILTTYLAVHPARRRKLKRSLSQIDDLNVLEHGPRLSHHETWMLRLRDEFLYHGNVYSIPISQMKALKFATQWR